MVKVEIKNARVANVSLSMADYSVLKLDLSLTDDGWNGEEKSCPVPVPTARTTTIQTGDCSLFTRGRADMDLADILGRIERGELKLSIGDSLLVGMKDGKKVEFVVTAVDDEAYRLESRDCLGKYVPMTKIQGFFDEVWGNLPDVLKNRIVPTERPYLSKGKEKSISRKLLFLPSAAEIFPPEDCYGDKGLYEQMDWYKDVHNRVRAFEGGGNADWYWTQSEYSGYTAYFCSVYISGSAYSYLASGTGIAAPVCFRISRL